MHVEKSRCRDSAGNSVITGLLESQLLSFEHTLLPACQHGRCRLNIVNKSSSPAGHQLSPHVSQRLPRAHAECVCVGVLFVLSLTFDTAARCPSSRYLRYARPMLQTKRPAPGRVQVPPPCAHPDPGGAAPCFRRPLLETGGKVRRGKATSANSTGPQGQRLTLQRPMTANL